MERMVQGNREPLLGLKRDPVFGPVIAFGLGGVLTEVLGDIALTLAPPSARDVAELLESIRSRKILGAFRGSPPVDRAALSKVIEAIGRIALDFPEIAEIDVNPLLVEGDRPVAADALVILSKAASAVREARPFKPDLQAVLTPASVAIVGASDDIRKWGGSALRNLLDGGYQGKIYRYRGGVSLDPGLRELADLPEAADWR